MFNSILGRNRDAFHPKTFRTPQHITASFLYRASQYIPQPILLSANGRATPMNIRYSLANAGTLVLTKDQNGYPYYTVMYPSIPVDR